MPHALVTWSSWATAATLDGLSIGFGGAATGDAANLPVAPPARPMRP
jgi:hypothetical protein